MSDGGLDRMNRRFAAVLKNVREMVPPAVLKSANEVADMQRRLAPVDEGDLKDSITVTPPGGTTPPYSQPGGSRTAGELEAIVTAGNSNVRYPHHVEHGTSKMSARPFFFPGWRFMRRRSLDRIKRAGSKAVRTGWRSP